MAQRYGKFYRGLRLLGQCKSDWVKMGSCLCLEEGKRILGRTMGFFNRKTIEWQAMEARGTASLLLEQPHLSPRNFIG